MNGSRLTILGLCVLEMNFKEQSCMKEILKPYQKEFAYSYTSGAYATIELLRERPELTEAVYLHSDCAQPELMEALCARHSIPVLRSDAAFTRINQKENSYVLGVFRKFPSAIDADAPHVVLVNPGDMGNLGTIVRTLVGCGLANLAVISPAADVWHPKTIRASMGALFHIRFQQFESFDAYRAAFPSHEIFPFMPGGGIELRPGAAPRVARFSLVFGNEACGLDEGFRRIGTCVTIPQSPQVDSLNLSIAVALGAYLFTL